MSEADSPNDQPAPTAIKPSEVAAFHSAASERLSPTPDDGWQTVDFPGAMSVDALPHELVQTLDDAIAPGVIHYSSAEIDPAMTDLAALQFVAPDTITPLQQLQQENAALRDRLAQVEQDLVQQIEQQLESACTLSQAEVTPVGTIASTVPALEQPQSLQLTHDRLQQLVQELERSHQTAQRQQILVETLTEQLESSQERIAQLERECALTEQRHNEQVQQVVQAESACRDLRLRLHRQQQQTMQFKAALEKCLEMPTVYENQPMPEEALSDGFTASDVLAVLTPKNQPVKPWSLSPAREQTSAIYPPPEQPKTLLKLLNHGMSEQGDAPDLLYENGALVSDLATPFGADGHENTTVDPSTLLDSDDPQFVTHLMQLIFPGAAGQPNTATDTLQADVLKDVLNTEATFDPSLPSAAVAHSDTMLPLEPCNQETTSADILTTAAPESMRADQQERLDGVPPASGAIVHAPSTLPADRADDSLWHDLATLITPLPAVASINLGADCAADTPDTPVNAVQATTDRAGIPPLFTAPHDAAPVVEAASLKASTGQTAPLTTWTWRDRLVKTNKAPQAPMTERVVGERMSQMPSKLLALSAVSCQSSVAQQTARVSNQADLTATPVSTAPPSPIVYPLRSIKKLPSLAAVDLPTFPRR